ncbi:MAG: hypothetical protein A2W91_09035 [Bacteroidetes bacterium GWF2_38_335]|nr:MAG: hypothetical protein A2W91_09035 [Bacteroidetes bacterium GWF2_38_335]OFY80515.1 MAG: hypothetical protein A2281_08760 [Bacteroidetes bacterium RIFOXYA12_FULL_38_20]HBS85874.1 TonB-dependent receptor [Bacteroidales bacterium]
MQRLYYILICILFWAFQTNAQQKCTVEGWVTDEFKSPVINADVYYVSQGKQFGTTTNNGGKFSLQIPSNQEITLIFHHLNFYDTNKKVTGKPGEKITLNVSIKWNPIMLEEVKVRYDTTRSNETMKEIKPIDIKMMPGPGDGFGGMMKKQMGVSTAGGELSSQYSVRGGNFDENLIYVNDIEVYRPFLTRSGQQEGLTFVNTDMIREISFSSGGFNARYGDKMSSVLDIIYKKPLRFGGSASASLLGGSVHIEGASKNYRFTHISGFRYKSYSYVLNSLDTKGDYKPSFGDFQTYLTYDVTDKFEINFLGNIAQNKYLFVPTDRETSWGTVNEALSLKIYFEGQEVDRFSTYFGAVSGIYKPREKTEMKFIVSAFKSIEEETFDILGQYYLNELDKQLGSDNLGDSINNIGIGSYLDHARNYLDATVLNFAHKGKIKNSKKKSEFSWGANIQHEFIFDRINEWKMLDSSGYSLPYTDSVVSMYETLNTEAELQSNRVSAYVMQSKSVRLNSKNQLNISAGIRSNYWDYNEQLLVSPRFTLAWYPKIYKPFVDEKGKNDSTRVNIMYRFSTGYYYQPPFYKELRDLDGVLNPEIMAQKSIHFVLGMDYIFDAWDRTFKLVTEAYYKHLSNLIPYEIDNVRIRYYARNNAKGFATGLDCKLNGEFVKGIESWVSLSIMQTKENLDDDYYYDTLNNIVYPGFIPRPSDQRVNFSMFFQDYLPNNKSYRMSLSLVYGTGLPFGPPNGQRYQSTGRFPAYRRVDIGFTKIIKTEDEINTNILKQLKNAWVTLEIFNLLGINNTISHTWVNDIYDRLYAVPNYLTGRRVNIKVNIEF